MDSYYDSIAPGYNELHMAEQLRKMTTIIADLGMEIPKRHEKLLDIGCGSGISTIVWNCDCTGIDPSEELIKIARKNYPNKKFVVANAEEIPFPDKTFDVITCITAIHNFSDIRKAIGEIKRVCKDRVIISVLRKSQKLDEIEKLIIINFRVKRIIMEEQDMIFICEIRKPKGPKAFVPLEKKKEQKADVNPKKGQK
jgi:ubiquinone/menaquinone biosynthesis C-methylase UbiE